MITKNKFFLQTIIIKNKFPIDILYYIDNILLKYCKYSIKWKIIANRLLYNKYELFNLIHEIHNYARDIHTFAHKLYNYKYNNIAKKYIRVGKNIHILAENLMNYVAN